MKYYISEKYPPFNNNNYTNTVKENLILESVLWFHKKKKKSTNWIDI